MKRIRRTALALLASTLALVIGLTTPIENIVLAAEESAGNVERLVEEDSEQLYVSDLKISVDADANKARQALVSAGYTVVDQDLKSGAVGDFVFLGYKTTTDVKDAITDISMMNMDGGFATFDYEEIAERSKANIHSIAEQFKTACLAFSDNVKAGGENAVNAKKILDLLQLSESDTTRLGDYLLSDSRTVDDYSDIIVKASTAVVTFIYNQLLVGTADINTSWMKRLSDSGVKTPTDAELSRLEKEYGERAAGMKVIFAEFVKNYAAAEARLKANGGKLKTDDKQADLDSAEALSMYVMDRSVDDDSDEGAQDAMYLSAYQTLDKYSYGDGTLAGYIIQCASTDGKISDIYPLLQIMSEGEYIALRFCGLENSIMACAKSSEISVSVSDNVTEETNFDTMYAKASALFSKAAQNGEVLHLWSGANPDLYKATFARTENALRVAAAQDEYNKLTTPIMADWQEGLLRLAGSVALISVGVTFLIATVTGYVIGGSTGFFSMMAIGYGAFFSTSLCGGWLAGAIIGMYVPLAAAAVAVAALIVVATVYIYDKIKEWYHETHPNYTAIPAYMCDYSDKNSYVTYTAVTGINGAPADINAHQGKQWNALYYIKDLSVGSPLTADENGIIFSAFENNYQVREGYSAVHYFQSEYPANLNSYEFSADNTIYLHYHTVSSLSGESDSDSVEGEYVSELCLASGSSVEEAYSDLKYHGFEVIEQPLNSISSDDSVYTLLGFKTLRVVGGSKNADPYSLAVKDIRVLCSTEQPDKKVGYRYGRYSYAVAGSYWSYSEDCYITIYYSCGKGTGTPIPAGNIYIGLQPDDHSCATGYEPVSLFSGSGAFKLGQVVTGKGSIYTNFEPEYSWVYMFFLPSTPYIYRPADDENGKASQLYVAGVFCADKTYLSDTEQGINDIVEYYNLYDCYMRKFLPYQKVQISDIQYYIILYTCNPYRAVSDIRMYTSTEGLQIPNIIKNDSTETQKTTVVGVKGSTKTIITYKTTTVACGYSLIGRNKIVPGIVAADVVKLWHYIPNYTIKNWSGLDGKSEDGVCTGLYVGGPCQGVEPLKYGELKEGTSDGDGFQLVSDLTDEYSEYNAFISPMPTSMVIYKTPKEKGKYIKAITVSSEKGDIGAMDTAICNLLAGSGGDEILRNFDLSWYHYGIINYDNIYALIHDVKSDTAFMLTEKLIRRQKHATRR